MEKDTCLRLGSAGEDVWRLKRRLMELGYYEARVKTVTHTRFGTDTLRAVRAFQAANGLIADGIAGPLTWEALFAQAGQTGTQTTTESMRNDVPTHLGAAAREAVGKALDGVSAVRRGVVLDALHFAIDPSETNAYPRSLYIRGANLYDQAGKPHVITAARVESGAKQQPAFYDGGRKAFMLAVIARNPAITGADCSGGVVGLFRHAGVVRADFDCSADGFASASRAKRIERDALLPADLLHRSGHIGLYVGGGYAVEWVGGAYGCQLTRLSGRRVWNFISQRQTSLSGWTGFLHPSYY